jgi:hypothetical protein
LKAGRYYSTQVPLFRELLLDGEWLRVETSEAYAISLTGGGDRWQSGQECTSEDGEPITKGDLDLTSFRGSYCASPSFIRREDEHGAIRFGPDLHAG